MIQRFDFCSFHGQGSMENDPEGIYCLHDDYEAMEARAIAAEAKLAEIEQQEPVGEIDVIEFDGVANKNFAVAYCDASNIKVGAKLYASPVQQSPAVAVPDDIAESLSYLDNTSYKKWKNNPNGFIAGDLEVSKLVKVVEFARAMLSTPTPSTEPTHWCNKCGYSGLFIVHDNCPYSAIQIKREAEHPDSAAVEPYGYVNPDDVYQLKTHGYAQIESKKTDYSTVPLYLHANPKRITEQDAREIAQHYKNWRDDKEIGNLISVDEWLNNECRPLLTKLNGDIDV